MFTRSEPTKAVDLVAGAVVSVTAGALTGAAAGFFWGGLGGRIAMRVLFLTSSDLVKGVTSDDGFEIGRISADSIFLIIAMTFIGGVLGAFWGLVRLLFRGPLWLITSGMTVALGAGAGGGLIVSTDGIDFKFLGPLWLAVALFVFLPAVWGTTVVLATDKLLHIPLFTRNPIPGIDARPLGFIGDALGWAGILAITTLGLIDLIDDLKTLT